MFCPISHLLNDAKMSILGGSKMLLWEEPLLGHADGNTCQTCCTSKIRLEAGGAIAWLSLSPL